MQCPFCHCVNVATARACRVCGGPLRATNAQIVPIATRAVKPTFIELARRTFDEKAAHLIDIRFSSDKNPFIIAIREDGVVQLLNADADEIFSFSVGRWFRKFSPICCALSVPDCIAIGHEDGQVSWRRFNGRKLKNPASHVGRVLALAANATHFYSGGSDGVIWATVLENNRKSRSCPLIEGLGALTTFAASPDAASIAVGCDDGAVGLCRINAQRTAAKLDWTRRGHDAPITSLAFSPNGQMLISRDKTGALCLWASQTSYQLPLSAGAQCSHAAPAFAGDNRLLAFANAKNGVSVFDVALGTLHCELPPLNETITHLAFATGAPWLLVAGAREIAVYEIG